MQPTIEIVRTEHGRFSCAVDIGGEDYCYVRDGLSSIAACVKNAAAALGDQFKFATIAYNRMPAEPAPVVQVPPRFLRATNDAF